MLYALGLGLGMDPTDPAQLRYVYEECSGGLRVLPTLAVTLAYPGHWIRDAGWGLDWQRAVHVEQGLRMHRPLPSHGTVEACTRVTAVVDKGPGKGVLLYSERRIHDAASGEPLADVSVVTLARGDGGRGGSPQEAAPAQAPHALPQRPPDASLDFRTSPQGSLLYRLCADRNPLHADPAVARAAGHERPIAHGLWTFGIAGHGLVELACGGEPGRLAAMSCRFRSPAFAGDTLRIDTWRDGALVSFRVSAPQLGAVVLDHGRAELAAA